MYEEYRNLEQNKQYELIYKKLMLEISNIKKSSTNLTDTLNIKKHIDEEIRQKILENKGIPTYIFNIIILLGNEYEKEIQEKITNYLITEFAAEFQLFISKEFNILTDIKKYYIKLNETIKDIENVYFNLPSEWNIKKLILNDIVIITKQKICDIFFFNNFTISEYLESAQIIINMERKLKINNELFNIYVPFMNYFFDNYFTTKIDFIFDLSNTKMKIFSNFLNLFQDFEKIFNLIEFYKNHDSLKLLVKSFCEKLIILIESFMKIEFICDYDNENMFFYNNKDLKLLIVILNSISYISESLNELDRSIDYNYKINLDSFIFKTLRNIESLYTFKLELYVRNILHKFNFEHNKVSKNLISIFEKNIFYFDIEDLFDDVKMNLMETIVIQILSRIYLLDFDEITAENMIYEVAAVKNYLKKKYQSIPSFNVLESYLKIFICSTENKEIFIENFYVLSNEIFSFEQIIWSLKDKDNVCDLLDVYLKRKSLKNENLELKNAD